MRCRRVMFSLALVGMLLLVARFCVYDVVTVPATSKCPKAGCTVLVDRWAYGYRLPWKATKRLAYARAEVGHWVTYNEPIMSRDEKVDTTDICIGRIAAAPGDTLWYNNDTGRIATSLDERNGFTHPLIVPQCSKVVPITRDNIQFYAITIMRHEPVKASVVNGQLCVNGRMVQQYLFQYDYYWVVTEHPKVTPDSRLFGFVPHVCLIGRID